MIDVTRRNVLGVMAQVSLARLIAGGTVVSWAAQALGSTTWAIKRASREGASAIAEIFNIHRTANLCPFPERIPPWTPDAAVQFLSTYTGTLLLIRDGTPVGFIGFIDYADPAAVSSIAPDTAPEIVAIALRFDAIPDAERLEAAKRLAAGAGRAFQRMGFQHCRATLRAEPGLYHMITDRQTVVARLKRQGAEHVVQIEYDVAALRQLSTEGF